MAPQDALPNGRIIFLDALRGLAALAVVGFHLAWLTPPRASLASVLPAPIMAVFEHALAEVAAHFVYLQDILGLRALAVQLWTLPHELQFYLVACVSLALSRSPHPFRDLRASLRRAAS